MSAFFMFMFQVIQIIQIIRLLFRLLPQIMVYGRYR